MKLLCSINVLTLIFLVEMVCGTRYGYHFRRYNRGKGNSYWYKKTCSYAKCQCLNKDTTPAFSAVLTQKQTVASNTAVKFDKVVTNIQDGYDNATGIFTAPTDGVYHISSTVMSPVRKKLFVSLYHNDVKITSIWLNPKGDTNELGTTNMVLMLKDGDEVAIRSRGNYQVHSNADVFSSFSGFLISK